MIYKLYFWYLLNKNRLYHTKATIIMSIISPFNLIDYSGLLSQSYLYPYWQYYYKDINISIVNSDNYKNQSYFINEDKFTTFAIKDDSVSCY